jgi:hypothetical protein
LRPTPGLEEGWRTGHISWEVPEPRREGDPLAPGLKGIGAQVTVHVLNIDLHALFVFFTRMFKNFKLKNCQATFILVQIKPVER